MSIKLSVAGAGASGSGAHIGALLRQATNDTLGLFISYSQANEGWHLRGVARGPTDSIEAVASPDDSVNGPNVAIHYSSTDDTLQEIITALEAQGLVNVIDVFGTTLAAAPEAPPFSRTMFASGGVAIGVNSAFDLHDDVASSAQAFHPNGLDRLLISRESVSGDPNAYMAAENARTFFKSYVGTWADRPGGFVFRLGDVTDHSGQWYVTTVEHTKQANGPDTDPTNFSALTNWGGTWAAGWYHAGTFVTHDGDLYACTEVVVNTDPAPDHADNTKWVQINTAPAVSPGTTVLGGTREPRSSDGSDGDFWVYGGSNGQLLSISENVLGAWVELARATYDTNSIDHFTHLTRDLHIGKLTTEWDDMADSEVDLTWAVAVNGAITLADSDFDGNGSSITIPASSTPRITYVFARFPAATDLGPIRITISGRGSINSGSWGRAADEGAGVPDNTAYQYWMAIINLQEVAELTFQAQKREMIEHTRYDGSLGGEALAQIQSEAASADRFEALEHLTRDLHVGDGDPEWLEADDSEIDLFTTPVTDPAFPPPGVTLSDSDFDNNGAEVTTGSTPNENNAIYVRLRRPAHVSRYRVVWEGIRSFGGNNWITVTGPDEDTYKYYFVEVQGNAPNNRVHAQKYESLDETFYTGGGAVPAGGTTGQAVIKSSDADYEVTWADLTVSEATTTAQGTVILARDEDVAETETDTTRALTVETGKSLVERLAPPSTVWNQVYSVANDVVLTAVGNGGKNVDTSITISDLAVGRPYEMLFRGDVLVTDQDANDRVNMLRMTVDLGDGAGKRDIAAVDINGLTDTQLLVQSGAGTVVTFWPTTEEITVKLQVAIRRNSDATVRAGSELFIGQAIAADLSEAAELHEFDTLPDATDYAVNRIIAADGKWYKNAVTDEDVANLYEGTIGRESFRFGDEIWRGTADGQTPNGLSSDGSWTANPDNAVAFLFSSSQRHIRVAIKESVYETAKGSAFAQTDHIAIKITYPDDSTEEVVCAYYNSFTADTRYLEWQHRHATDNYAHYSKAAGTSFKLEFFTVDSNNAATTTPLLTHDAALQHWILFDVLTDNGRAEAAQQSANAALARLDALDNQVDGAATPLQDFTVDEDTDLGPHSTRTLWSKTIDSVTPDTLVVIDWEHWSHLSTHAEHSLPGSTPASGRMYVQVTQFGLDLENGEFGFASDADGVNLKPRLQSDGTTTVQTSLLTSIQYASGTGQFVFTLEANQVVFDSTARLYPPVGFVMRVRLFRNTSVLTATEGSIHTQLQDLTARTTAIETGGFRKGDEVARITGLSGGGLQNQSWTFTDTTNLLEQRGDDGGLSSYLHFNVLYGMQNAWGLIAEVTRTGVEGAFSRVFIPWSSFWMSRQMFAGMWRETAVRNSAGINNQIVHVVANMNNADLVMRVSCPAADTTGTLTLYLAV